MSPNERVKDIVTTYLTDAQNWCIICGRDLDAMPIDDVDQHLRDCFVKAKKKALGLLDAD